MKMQRSGLMCAVLLLLAVACGDDTSTADEGTTIPPTAPPTTVDPAFSGSGAAPTDVASAREAWASHTGEPYLLESDWNTEGLVGVYCVFGVAGDPGATEDASQALADAGDGTTDCQLFADAFTDPVSVESLQDSAESIVDAGGTATFDENGVPTTIDGPDNQIAVTRFSFNPQE